MWIETSGLEEWRVWGCCPQSTGAAANWDVHAIGQQKCLSYTLVHEWDMLDSDRNKSVWLKGRYCLTSMD